MGADLFAAAFGGYQPVTSPAGEAGEQPQAEPLTYVYGDVPAAARTAFGVVASIVR
jgi:hypothetical protein